MCKLVVSKMDNLKRKYIMYLIRWQMSTPVLACVLYYLSPLGIIPATIIANLIGGLVFFWVDYFIFDSENSKSNMKNNEDGKINETI
jgi:membrane protein YqaA with SNARE-associated domain